MSDTYSRYMNAILFYAVVLDPKQFCKSHLQVEAKNDEIESCLVKTGLLKSEPKGRALHLSANDATWRWVEEHLDAELPKTKAAFLILNTMRGKLSHYLATSGVRLSHVLAPGPHSDELIVSALAPADQVRQAYLDVSNGQLDVRVRLRDLRPKLPNLNRAQQDETLKGMQRDGWLVLYPNDDPQDRNSDDEVAALMIGDRHRDLVYLHREQRQ